MVETDPIYIFFWVLIEESVYELRAFAYVPPSLGGAVAAADVLTDTIISRGEVLGLFVTETSMPFLIIYFIDYWRCHYYAYDGEFPYPTHHGRRQFDVTFCSVSRDPRPRPT